MSIPNVITHQGGRCKCYLFTMPKDLCAIVPARSNSAGAHEVYEDVFVDQRASKSAGGLAERSIDLVIGIGRGTALPDAPSAMAQP